MTAKGQFAIQLANPHSVESQRSVSHMGIGLYFNVKTNFLVCCVKPEGEK